MTQIEPLLRYDVKHTSLQADLEGVVRAYWVRPHEADDDLIWRIRNVLVKKTPNEWLNFEAELELKKLAKWWMGKLFPTISEIGRFLTILRDMREYVDDDIENLIYDIVEWYTGLKLNETYTVRGADPITGFENERKVKMTADVEEGKVFIDFDGYEFCLIDFSGVSDSVLAS